jgi:hypothetical protein
MARPDTSFFYNAAFEAKKEGIGAKNTYFGHGIN